MVFEFSAQNLFFLMLLEISVQSNIRQATSGFLLSVPVSPLSAKGSSRTQMLWEQTHLMYCSGWEILSSYLTNTQGHPLHVIDIL